MDATANLTKNWRLFTNVAKQETIQNDIGREQIQLANYIRDNLVKQPWKDMRDSPALGEQITYMQRFDSSIYIPLLAATNRNGTVALEQRKWRVNVGSNYQFATGRLKGFGIGTAARWQVRGATGYPLVRNQFGVQVPDLTRPFWAPSTWNGDVWVSYRRRIMGGKVNWSIQANARNLLGDGGIIPVVTNPDGKLAVFRNPNPLELFLTNRLSF